jgi:hypothetical protein
MLRPARVFLLLMALVPAVGCQSPTSATSTTNIDTFVDASISPNPANAAVSTGKTYRVVRGNNQPDEVIPYQWVTTFSVTVSLNSTATSSDVDLTFPVTVTSVTGKVEQASGGIVTPPTGGEVEHYESIILSSSASQVSAVGAGIQIVFQVWYALPSGNREALITETIAMKDSHDTAKTFSKAVQIRIAP